jgi:nucleoside-diphosphate-sugar epimerase
MLPKVLVTGANGYTGANLCRFLAERGVAVRGMYYRPDGEPDFEHDLIEWLPGDLRDRASLEEAVRGIDTLHNIAALYRVTNVPNSTFWAVNAEGVKSLVECAAAAGVRRFVHCSTIGVHGTVRNPPAIETSELRPDDYYQYTKLKGEEIARTLGAELGLQMAIIRPAAIYGPLETRFLKLARMVNTGRFVMFGKGEVPYQFTYIDDLCEAFVLCAERDEAVGETFLIADDAPLTINGIVSIVARELGVAPPRLRLPFPVLYGASLLCEAVCLPFRLSPPLHRRRASWFNSARAFDIGKAKKKLGFQPNVRPEDGLPAMIRSYREAGWL